VLASSFGQREVVDDLPLDMLAVFPERSGGELDNRPIREHLACVRPRPRRHMVGLVHEQMGAPSGHDRITDTAQVAPAFVRGGDRWRSAVLAARPTAVTESVRQGASLCEQSHVRDETSDFSASGPADPDRIAPVAPPARERDDIRSRLLIFGNGDPNARDLTFPK
jgi:chromosome condensin MukBEF MukE localization factor